MLVTSELYKQHFEAGSIQEYKVIISGIEYTDSVLYDVPTVTQNLFDKPTLTVGSLTISELNLKLKVPSGDIESSAPITFHYRYVSNDLPPSEWVQKFSGKISKRTKFSEEVTTIQAKSKASNYTTFLSTDTSAITSYPASNRLVTQMCADILGVTVDNIEDVYDANNVEFPNEMTAVEVLQNIAKLSGGNWIITEDDKLRLVVLRSEVLIDAPEYRSQSYEQHSTISPISQVQVYWDDVSAFEAGDDTMSTIIINTPWATRNSTDYIYSVLGGYQYKPTQGSQVYADPAIQLGDTFSYGDTDQLVASVIWHFDGSVTGDFNAPQNNDSNLDDPRETLIKNEFKKKISLGDSYQGVTIDRENGIEMLLSPDGTMDHAIGRFYADLTRGLAFQYREDAQDTWRDWLYFDKAEATFKLSLYSTSSEVDAKILLSVEQVHNGNIIAGLNGDLGYMGWTGGSDSVFTGRIYKDIYRTYEHGFEIIEDDKSLSGFNIEFINYGYDISPFGYVIPDIQYSYRARVINFKPMSIDVLEYLEDRTLSKTTNFEYSTVSEYIDLTLDLQSDTMYVRLKFNHDNARWNDPITLTEQIFNRGIPKNFFESAAEARAYAKANIAILGGEIDLNTEKIDRVNGDIHNTTVNIDAITGVQIRSTSGTGLRITNASGNDTITLNTDGTLNAIGGTFQNITVTGNLTAGTIAGLQFNNSKITFPNGKLALNSTTNSIEFGNFRLIHGLFSDDGGGLTIDGMKFSQGGLSTNSGIYMWQGGVTIMTENLHAGAIGDVFGSGPMIFNATYNLGLNDSMVRFYRDSNNFVRTTPVSGLMAMNNDLGSPTERIDTIHLNNQPNVSSDTRYKYDIQDIDPLLIEIIGREVKPKQYRTQFDDKIHFGYIAQDVERALYKYCGHDKDKYAMLSKSESYMSLLYGELNVIMDSYNRSVNNQLEERIKVLEGVLNERTSNSR